MTLPLFNLFELPNRTPLYDSLRAVGPRRAWPIMRELFELDLPRYERDSPAHERSAEIADLARTHLGMARALADDEIDRAATRFGTYGPRLQFESTFVTMWLQDPATLFGEVIDVVGERHLTETLDTGRGVLLAPLHIGPSYVIPPLVAFRAPTRLVFHRMNFSELRDAAFPDLDIDAVAIDDGRTFATGLRTLRDGGVFAMFPELDPRGQGLRHRPVPFLGSTVRAPEGPVVLAQAARAPIVPVVLESHENGRFTLRYEQPVIIDRGADAIGPALDALWSIIERHVRDRAGDWEMWIEFDRMLDQEHA